MSNFVQFNFYLHSLLQVFDLEFSGLTIRAMNLALPLVAFVHSFHTLPESVDKTIYRKKFTRATEIFRKIYF